MVSGLSEAMFAVMPVVNVIDISPTIKCLFQSSLVIVFTRQRKDTSHKDITIFPLSQSITNYAKVAVDLDNIFNSADRN